MTHSVIEDGRDTIFPPPALVKGRNGMDFVTNRDGTRIAFAVTGRGPPLVMVHGTTAGHTRWAAVLPEPERSFTVLAMDRRGRGESGDAANYEMARENNRSGGAGSYGDDNGAGIVRPGTSGLSQRVELAAFRNRTVCRPEFSPVSALLTKPKRNRRKMWLDRGFTITRP